MEQTELLAYSIAALERLAIPYMLVGSFASTAYGEPRFTEDLDIVLDLESSKIPPFCQSFPAPAFYLSEPAVRAAVEARFQFNVLHPATANKIDFFLPRADDWGMVQMQRRRRIQLLPECMGFAATPEDVILGKLLYYAEGGSEKHLRDITGILRISGDAVARDEVRLWAEKLGVLGIWQAILEKLATSA